MNGIAKKGKFINFAFQQMCQFNNCILNPISNKCFALFASCIISTQTTATPTKICMFPFYFMIAQLLFSNIIVVNAVSFSIIFDSKTATTHELRYSLLSSNSKQYSGKHKNDGLPTVRQSKCFILF